MDYSKLSAADLLALKSGDYSKVSDEGLLSLKGVPAPAAPQAPAPQEGLMGTTLQEMAMAKLPAPFKTAIDTFNTINQFSPMNVLTKTGPDLVNKGFDAVGAKANEFLGSKGVNPNISAAVGTAIDLIPEAAEASFGAIPGKRALVKAAGETVIGKAIRYTGDKEAEALAVKAAEMPIAQTAIREGKEVVKSAAGKAIGKAEEALGIAQKDTSTAARRAAINTPEKITKFADRAEKLAQKGADKLAKMASPETLQFYRKTAEDAIGRAGKTISNEARNKLYKTKQVFADAIGKTEKGAKAGFGDAMQKYKDAEVALKNLPKQFKAQADALKVEIVKAKNLAKEQARTRKKALIGGGAAAGTGIVTTVIKKLTGGN